VRGQALKWFSPYPLNRFKWRRRLISSFDFLMFWLAHCVPLIEAGESPRAEQGTQYPVRTLPASKFHVVAYIKAPHGLLS